MAAFTLLRCLFLREHFEIDYALKNLLGFRIKPKTEGGRIDIPSHFFEQVDAQTPFEIANGATESLRRNVELTRSSSESAVLYGCDKVFKMRDIHDYTPL